MTVDAPADNAAPAQAAPASPAPAATQPPPASSPPATPVVADPAPTATQPPSEPQGYKVPDAFKEKPWTQKIKSEEDLWKQLDNAQELIGRKRAVPDFEKATPEEIEEFLSTTRPADKSAYKFNDDAPFAEPVADIFMEAGITPYQGNKIIEKYQALEAAKLEEMTSADGFKDVMTAKFGEKYDGVVSSVVKEHKTHLSPESQALFDKLPNDVLGAVYELTANMQKAYGAQESGAPAAKPGVVPPAKNVEQVRSDLRAQLRAITDRPHTEADKQKLIAQIDATYR